MNSGTFSGTRPRQKHTPGIRTRSWNTHPAQKASFHGSAPAPSLTLARNARGVPGWFTADYNVLDSGGFNGSGTPLVTQEFNLNGGLAFPAINQGPAGVVTIDGLTTWWASAGFAGVQPTLQTMRTDKNAPGLAVNLGSAATFNHSASLIADGATVGISPGLPLAAPDLPGGYSGINTNSRYYWGIVDNPTVASMNGGTFSAASFNSQGFVSMPIFYGNVSIGTRADFVSRELYRGTGDGAHTPTIASHVGFFCEPFAAATQNIGLFIDDATTGVAPGASSSWGIYNRRNTYVGNGISSDGQITLGANNQSNTATRAELALSSTQTFATTATMTHYFMNWTGTDVWSVNPNLLGMTTGINVQPTIKNNSATTLTWGLQFMFSANPTVTVDTQTGANVQTITMFNAQGTVGVANSGTYTSGSYVGFTSGPTINGTGCTLTTATHFKVSDTAGSGATLTNQFGIDIPALAKASTSNVAIRTVPPIVYTPTVCTCTSNAATVPVNIAHAKVTNSSAATCTITLSTTGALDGQELRVRFLDATAVSQTVTFTNSETGKAGAPPVSLGSTTIPTTYRFIFNGGTSKWTYCSE